MTINCAISGFFRHSPDRQRHVFKCKFCDSKNIVKYGQYQGLQRYFCKDCERKFADNDALPHMKTPSFQVASVLDMFYERKSICAIRGYIEQQYGNYPSISSIYRWIVRFTEMAIEETEAYRPKVGDVWIAAETSLKINGEKWWIWDIIDSETRFLLASHMSRLRTMQNAQALVAQATEKAGKFPRIVITNTLQAYLNNVELVPKNDIKSSQYMRFIIKPSKDMTEEVNKPLKRRIKVIQKTKKEKRSRLALNGCSVHYNFFKPHKDLNYRTPAEKAGVGLSFDGWLSIVKEDSFPRHGQNHVEVRTQG